MRRIRFTWLFVYSLTAAFSSSTVLAATGTREWSFSALLDGKEIGYQTFHLTERGEERVMVSEAHYKVKLLFVTVYTYEHHDKEVWQGGCLGSIESSTDDNGEKHFVRGETAADGFAVESTAGRQQLPGCVMTFAYWNPQILDGQRLLNSETGEYMAVEVEDRGRETVTAAGREQPAERYTLVTDEFSIDLWYSPERLWLGLETTTKSGRRLRYLLK